MTLHSGRALLVALACSVLVGSSASACSWFEPCKPVARHVKKVKPKSAKVQQKTVNEEVAELKKRVAVLEGYTAALFRSVGSAHTRLDGKN